MSNLCILVYYGKLQFSTSIISFMNGASNASEGNPWVLANAVGDDHSCFRSAHTILHFVKPITHGHSMSFTFVPNKDIDQAYCSQRLKCPQKHLHHCPSMLGHRKKPNNITKKRLLMQLTKWGKIQTVVLSWVSAPDIYFYENIYFYQKGLFSIFFPKIWSKTVSCFRKALGVLKPAFLNSSKGTSAL